MQRAIEIIYDRHGDCLSLDELANSSMVSKFHFIRMFSRSTGVTPARFLRAVRIQEAKRLLLTTDLNVAAISNQVGYSSSGTFTRRFTRSVGITPIHYRRMGNNGGFSIAESCMPRRHGPGPGTVATSLTGYVNVPGELWSQVFVGLVGSPVLEGPGIAHDILEGAGTFRLEGIPDGAWYLHAVALGIPPSGDSCAEPEVLWDMVGPIELAPATSVRADLLPRPLNRNRPPILLALPLLDPVPVDAWPGPAT